MSDPTGGGDLLTRIVIERKGGELLGQTRKEVAALGQDIERFPTLALGAAGGAGDQLAGPFKNLNRELTQGEGSLRHVRTALTGLAFEATATRGPVGALASALLLFGGGSGLVIGIAAGVGAIGLAWRLLSKDMREAADTLATADKAFRQSIAGTAGAPLLALRATQAQIRDVTAQLAKARQDFATAGSGLNAGDDIGALIARRRIDSLSQALQLLQGTAGRQQAAVTQAAKDQAKQAADVWVQSFLDELAQAQTAEQVMALHQRITEAPSREAGTRAGAAWKAAFLAVVAESGGPLTARRHLEIATLTSGFQAPAFGGGAAPDLLADPRRRAFPTSLSAGLNLVGDPHLRDLQAYNEELNQADQILRRLHLSTRQYNDEVRALKTALDAGQITTDQYNQAVKDLNKEMDRGAHLSAQLAASIIGAVSGAIAAIVSGGSAGGILSGIGGIIGLIPGGQVAGAVVGGLGAIVSAGESGSRGVRIDSYSAEAIRQMQAAANLPQRFTFNILSPTTGEVIDQVEYELGRRANRDAMVRTPRG